MTAHDPSHEGILERVMTGELERTSAVVRALMESCDDCREALDNLGRVEELLASAARVEQEALSEADPDLVADVPRLFKEIVAEQPAAGQDDAREPMTKQPGRRVPGPWLAAAASVLLLLGAWYWFGDRGARTPLESVPGIRLGAGLELLAPLGPGADLSVFRWDYDPGDGWCELLIWDDSSTAAASSEAIVGPLELTGSSWTADVGLPDAVRWSVTLFDAGGAPIATRSASAQR